MIDELRKRRAEMARQVEVLDRVTAFVAALSAECGIAAEIETDDGDVIVCIPQVVEREPVPVKTPDLAPPRPEAVPITGAMRQLSAAPEPAVVVPEDLGETREPAPAAKSEPPVPAAPPNEGATWTDKDDEDLLRRLAKHDGRAEAALLWLYGKRLV